MKRCIIDFHPNSFRKLLQLPDGALIEDVRMSFERHGTLEVRISGCGWETQEGTMLRYAIGIMDADGLITWEFENEHNT